MRRVALLCTLLALVVMAGGSHAAGKRKVPPCSLAVDNKSPYRALVHIDGVYWGWVAPRQRFTFQGVPGGPCVLYGTTQYAEFFWGPQPLKCEGEARWDLAF